MEEVDLWMVKSQNHSSSYCVQRIADACTTPEYCFVKCKEIVCAGLCACIPARAQIMSARVSHLQAHPQGSFHDGAREQYTTCQPVNLSTSQSNSQQPNCTEQASATHIDNQCPRVDIVSIMRQQLETMKDLVEDKTAQSLLATHITGTMDSLFRQCQAVASATLPPPPPSIIPS